MIDFKEIGQDGEDWELFARDFLKELGFFIESSPDRGPDGKKDLIVTEEIRGNFGNYKFKWLVSCKHFANRAKGNSVSEKDEPNILERIKSFKCDGFLGFYSTIASSGLNTRLYQLKENKDLKDFRLFDFRQIEDYLITKGFSKLIIKYFPESNRKIKPLQRIVENYVPLICQGCGVDILEDMYKKQYVANYVQVVEFKNGVEHVHDAYWACKGDCDGIIQQKVKIKYKYHTNWWNIGDLAIPSSFLNWLFENIRQINNGSLKYDDIAFQKEKEFIIGISQKWIRQISKEEIERMKLMGNWKLENLLKS